MLGRMVGKLVESLGTHFAGIAMCIGRNVLKRCLREVSELHYFNGTRCRTGHDVQSEVRGLVVALVAKNVWLS